MCWVILAIMTEHTGLGDRGQAIYKAYSKDTKDPARLALALEAARIADRLDELDSVIQGKGVLQLMQFRVLDNIIQDDPPERDINVEVKFQSVLGEARQQAIAFSGILKTLGLEEVAGEVKPAEKPKSGRSELERKRAEREAQRKAAGK